MYDHFPISDHAKKMREKLLKFMDDHIYPSEKIYKQQVEEGDRWQPVPIMEELKAKGRESGLWNVNHVQEEPDVRFLDVFERHLVEPG